MATTLELVCVWAHLEPAFQNVLTTTDFDEAKANLLRGAYDGELTGKAHAESTSRCVNDVRFMSLRTCEVTVLRPQTQHVYDGFEQTVMHAFEVKRAKETTRWTAYCALRSQADEQFAGDSEEFHKAQHAQLRT